MIIGLSGYARSGKDEAAKVLVEEFGFTRVAFADKLRDFLYAENPIVSVWRIWDGEPGVVRVQDVIDRYTWDNYKSTMYGEEIRELLQRLGTEAGRQTLWDTIWIDAAFAPYHEDDNIVVTDCRFPNEAQAIRSRGGYIWRIERYGVGPANAHESETSLDDYEFDLTIKNDGTLEEFRDKVQALTYWETPKGTVY
jgi:hypothetical protein